MGRKAIVENSGRWRGAEIRAARGEVLGQSVSLQTMKGYLSRANVFRRFVKRAGGGRAVPGKKFWFPFCKDFSKKSKNISRSGLEGYRSAILKLQMLGDFPGKWAGDEDVVVACAAGAYKAGVKKKAAVPRGAVSCEQAEALAGWMEEKGRLEMAEAVRALWGTHSREEELLGLKKEDIRNEGIEIPNKNFNANSGPEERPRIIKPWSVISEKAREILVRKGKEAQTGRLLFPCSVFRLHQLRGAMKEGARALDFPDDLALDIPHAFRHGGIADLVEKGRGEEVRSSVASLRRYGVPNEARRGDKKAKKAFGQKIKEIAKKRAGRK